MVRQPEKTLRLTTALKGEETGCEGQTKAWPVLWLRETRNLYVGKGMGSGVRVQTFPLGVRALGEVSLTTRLD